MGKFYGADQNQVIGIFESGTYGSAVAGSSFWWGLVQSNDVDDDVGVINVRYAGQADRSVGQFVDGPLQHNGTLTFFPQNWRFLWLALGSLQDTGSPSPYQHNIREANNTFIDPYKKGNFPSFTIEDAQVTRTGSNFIRTINGCVVDSTTVNFNQGEPISVELNYIGQTQTFSSGAVTAVTADTSRPYMWFDGVVHIPSGTQLTEVKTMAVSINNNQQADRYVNVSGGRRIAEPIPTNRDYEITATINGNDQWAKTMYDQYFLGGSTFNMIVEAKISAGSREAFIAFSGCKLTGMSAPTGAEGVAEHSLTILPQNASAIVNDEVFRYGLF